MNMWGNKMKKSIVISSTIAAAVMVQLALPTIVSADGGFLTDRNGKIVVDGFGECVSIIKIKHRPNLDNKHCVTSHKKMHKKMHKKVHAKPAPKPIVHENIDLAAHALFDTNKSDLRNAGISELDELASKLKSYHYIDNISITGHTDSRGSEAYNQALSERRAASVKSYLVSKGINSSVISTNGAGESSPVASNKTAEGRQKNRHVVIMIKARK